MGRARRVGPLLKLITNQGLLYIPTLKSSNVKKFTRSRLSFYSMSCGPQLSGAIRKVTMCHPPLRGGDDTVPAAYAYTFSPLMQALRACMGVKSGIY